MMKPENCSAGLTLFELEVLTLQGRWSRQQKHPVSAPVASVPQSAGGKLAELRSRAVQEKQGGVMARSTSFQFLP